MRRMNTTNLRRFHSANMNNIFSSRLSNTEFNQLMEKFGGKVLNRNKSLSTVNATVEFTNSGTISDELIYRLCVHAADGDCLNFGVLVEETTPNQFSTRVYTD